MNTERIKIRLFHFLAPAHARACAGSIGQLWLGRHMIHAKKSKNRKENDSVQSLCSAKKVSPGML